MSRKPRTATRRAWAERVKRFELAGQSVAQFCQAEGVSPASFYQWRRKLRSDRSLAPAIADRQSLAPFLPVKLAQNTPAQPATVMSVELPGGVRVRLEVAAGDGAQS